MREKLKFFRHLLKCRGSGARRSAFLLALLPPFLALLLLLGMA